MLRELNPSEIDEVLMSSTLGRIGCRQGDKIFIMPVSYAYEHDMVYCQSYEGMKVSLMREYPDVCFEVEWLGSFDEWKTVLAWGIYEELSHPDDVAMARSRLSYARLEQKASLSSLPPAESSEQVRGRPEASVVYYRIRLHELSGRYQSVVSRGGG